ncbi:bifunctional demethylmenaquinone methyltransferase/2-methoxy-6-polyprenyl-1,4-benzoquinol methylase UbiE [Cyanobacteria bacterium FACHB-DQ100]|uniref:bifunctional demethylmenaquinone methyltransferase/2-methoxy-6-polyprenyl-1,4-benzoquinol methylase UbiE n=1 Tax=Leptolyngbya sp. DQ-M1 TaxID=2933920 RepID=UPI001992EA6A|nr:bifunctional demethylmenaquinone methyltransferase/2-methoxy-6-polyprenyl-1,4-benzoquinol methylase UbiE [Cyanobacteria bacterium FACHB-DQ100]
MNSDHIQALFDRIAPVYDELNNGLSFGQHRIWKRMTVKWSGAKPGNIALDLCCGSGDIAQMLAEVVGRTGQVYGVDFSAAQLEVARDRSERRCIKPPIHWVKSDVLDLPFSDNHFDCATMGYGLRNVVDILGSLKEIHRVLKPGAKAAILDMHRPDSNLVRAFQQWYLDEVVVPAAQRFGFTEEYAYISPSLDKFPTGREQVGLANQAGFTSATHYPIAGGTMGVLVITK